MKTERAHVMNDFATDNKHDRQAIADVVQCAESLLNGMKPGVIVCVA